VQLSKPRSRKKLRRKGLVDRKEAAHLMDSKVSSED